MHSTHSDTSSTSGSESSNASSKTFFSRTVDEIVNGKAGKMFVGGLSQATTPEGLRFYFSQFGVVEEAVVMRDSKTRLSRGFGFVVYVDPKVIEHVCAKEHFLDGKRIDPQPAIRTISPARSVHNVYKKLFIGGISQQITVEDLKAYFAKFGEVEDVILKIDFSKRQHRGFGFITFYNDEVSDVVCSIRYHTVKGKVIETKPAQKKEFVSLTPAVPSLPFCGMAAQAAPEGYSPTLVSQLSSFFAPSSMLTEPLTVDVIKQSRLLSRIAQKYSVSPSC